MSNTTIPAEVRERIELVEVLKSVNWVMGMYISNTEKFPDFKMDKESTITEYFRQAILKSISALSQYENKVGNQ